MAFKRLLKPFSSVLINITKNISDSEEYLRSADLIFCDSRLPDGNPYDILNRSLSMPIIVVTGLGDAQENQDFVEAGAAAVWNKPVVEQSLQSLIEQTFPYSLPNQIDLTYLNEISDGDIEFKQELLQIYLSETPIELKTLFKSMKKNEIERCANIIHKFKSKLRIVGFTSLLNQAANLEKRLRSGNINNFKVEVASFIKTMETTNSIVKKAYRKIINNEMPNY